MTERNEQRSGVASTSKCVGMQRLAFGRLSHAHVRTIVFWTQRVSHFGLRRRIESRSNSFGVLGNVLRGDLRSWRGFCEHQLLNIVCASIASHSFSGKATGACQRPLKITCETVPTAYRWRHETQTLPSYRHHGHEGPPSANGFWVEAHAFLLP